MATAQQGAIINLYVRDFGTTQAWKKITCNENLSFQMSNDVNTKKTKCGVFKGLLIPDMKITGSGSVNFSPTATETSYDAIQVDQQAIQKKDFRIQDDSTFGTVIMINGSGYWSQSEVTFNNGETVDFTFTFEVDGAIGTSES